MNAKQVFKMLMDDGWVHVRTNGSHWVFRKNGKSVVVPFHGNHDLAIGTLRNILRKAELTQEEKHD